MSVGNLLTLVFSFVGHVLSILSILSFLFVSNLDVIRSANAASIAHPLTSQKADGSPTQLQSFFFNVPIDPAAIERAELVYNAPGARTPAGTRRSINGRAPFGGFLHEDVTGATEVVEPIAADALRHGVNSIVFLPNAYGDASFVQKPRLQVQAVDPSGKLGTQIIQPLGFETDRRLRAISFSDNSPSIDRLISAIDVKERRKQTIDISYPVDGSHFGDRALVRGIVHGVVAGAGLRLTIGGRRIPHDLGMFEAIIERPTGVLSQGREDAANPTDWSVMVEASFADGRTASRALTFTRPQREASLSQAPEVTLSLRSDAPFLSAFGAKVGLTEGFQDGQVSVRCNRFTETPESSDGLLNVTMGQCTSYRIQRLGATGPVSVELPARLVNLPRAFESKQARVFSYSERNRVWAALAESVVDVQNSSTVSTLREQSATIVSGVLKDDPMLGREPALRDQSAIQSLAEIDALSGHISVAPPVANPQGSARVVLPIFMRPQRGKLGRLLQMSYDSNAGQGSVGQGWSLDVPMIAVDTKWGVPAYDATRETESYVFGGQELVAFAKNDAKAERPYLAPRMSLQDRAAFLKPDQTTEFRLRRDETYERFVRHGSGPGNYWWQVIRKDGVHEFYGYDPKSGSITNEAVRQTAGGATFQWARTRLIDLDGHTAEYSWNNSACGLIPGCVSTFKLQKLRYNGHLFADDGKASETQLSFNWSSPTRNDPSVNARYGIAQVMDSVLERITTQYGTGYSTFFAEQRFRFKPSTFGKTLLTEALYEAAPFNSSTITDAELVNHQCDMTSANTRTLEEINKAGKTKRVICLRYHDPQNDKEPGALAAAPFQNVKQVSTSRVDNTKFDGAFGLVKGISAPLGSASILGTNTSKEMGASLYLGFSLPPAKEFSVGFKTGATERSSEGHSSLVDMTGDGIADLVQETGTGLVICEGKRQAGSIVYESNCLKTQGAPDKISRENGTSFSLGAEAFVSAVFAGASFTDSSASRTTYFTDADGDGLTDIVDQGTVYFNRGRQGDTVVFMPTSPNLKSLAPGGGTSTIGGQISELGKSFDAQRSAAQKNRKYAPLIDLVQTWRAPFDGAIVLGGNFLSLATPGDGSTGADDVKGGARLAIERSRGNNLKPCYAAPLAAGDNPFNCFESPGDVAAKPQDVFNAIPAGQAAPLVMRVQAGDIVYARMSSTSDAKTPWSDLDLFVSYLSYDPAACKDGATQRPFDCGARWKRVGEVLSDVQAESDATKKLGVLRSGLAQCVRTWPTGGAGNELDLSNPAKLCDATARQPYYWSLAQDVVQAGQLTDVTMLPQDGVAVFSGALSFPSGTAPLRITLVSRAAPAAGDQQDLRLALEPADALSLWTAKPFSLDITGRCSGANYTGPVAPTPSRIECSATGDRITVHLQSAGFVPSGQQARLELREITDTTLLDRRESSGFDWSTLTWDEAPRVVVTPDAPVGNPSASGIDAATLGQLSRVPSVITLSPYLRNRYFVDIQPEQIGTGTLRKLIPAPPGQPPVYRDEPFNLGQDLLRGERAYVRGASGASPTKDFRSLIAGEAADTSKWKVRGERFDPLVADNGFLLPGACAVGSNCTYEYRLAHVFSTLGPALTSGSTDSAFAFDADVLVNGKRVRLRNLGAIGPTGKCTGEDKNEELDPHRPVDCVVSGVSTPTPPANGFPEQIGISFSLTDRNEVTGRESAYAFDATPGDVLQILVRVRPLWNATTNSYESCGNAACTPSKRKPRTIEKLHEKACLNPNGFPGGCDPTDGPWLPLRLAEFRLGISAIETSFLVIKNQYGLNLAKTTGDRRFDLVRLSTPISFSEHYDRLKAAEPAHDHRGWSRFAVRASNYDDDGKVTGTFATPAFPRVRAENEVKKDKFDELVNDLQQKVKTASSCNAANSTCKQSLRDTAAKADTRNTYPLSMRFLDPVPSFTSAKAWCDAGFGAATPGICQSWLKPETHGHQADLPPTCGRPLIGTIVPCFIGPNEKIWINLPASASTAPTVRLASAHRGPEELGLTESAFALDAIKRMAPTATSILAPPLASTSSSWAATLGVSNANGGVLNSQSSNQSYYIDLNGDGYPDPVINGVAFLTGPNGLPRADWFAQSQLAGVAKSSSFSQLSLGGGNATTAISSPYANGASDSTQSPAGDASRGPQISEGRVNPVGQAAGPEARLAPGFGFTFATGDSVPDDDLIDLNGDGLPDAVKINGSQINTRLNIGSQFVGAGTLDARKPLGGVDMSGSLGFNLGWKTASGAFGGGLSMSRNNSMSRATLIDVNGDGLVDSVLPGGNGDLSVAFNNGWGFEPAISIPIPGFSFPDSGASETMIVGIGGHLSWFPGPLCWPTPFCFVVINPAFSKTDTLGRNLVSMLDVNGDGLVDFASTEGFYQGGILPGFPSSDAQRKLRVHLNAMGKADKLKTIINPTGTTIGLEYALFGNDSIRNPKAVWGLSEVRVTDGFRTAVAESEDQDILITQINYDRGVYDRAERRFLGFGQMVQVLRGCADARAPLLSSVALSGRCDGTPPKFLRRLVKKFDTQSIYTSGLPLEEVVTAEDETKVIHLTSTAYTLSPGITGAPNTGLQNPYTACGADTAKLAITALDDICFATFEQQLRADIQARGINTVDADGNPANDGRWAGLRLSPQIKAVRKNVREAGVVSLRSLVLYGYDATGNVTAMVDFGHVRNPGDTQDETRDDFRVDITYSSITPLMDKINTGLTGKVDPAEVLDRAATLVARQGARFDRGAKVLRARSAVYDPQGANLSAQCRLLANDLQTEEVVSNFCADLVTTSLKGNDLGNQFDAAVRKAGFAPEDVILSRIFRDTFGNPVRTLSPFNYRGDWIDTRLSYERDPFRLKPSMIGEAHCLYRPGGARPATMSTRNSIIPSDACTFEGGTRSMNVVVSAWHVSSAAYDPHSGSKAWDADINRNTLFYDRDGWGRLRSILSNWDQLDADTSFIAPEARAHYDTVKATCAADATIPCPTTIMMHLSYQDHRLDSVSPWQARTARYVDGSLYAGHSTQFVRTVESVSFVDGLNRGVRTAKSADVCDEKTIDDQIDQHINIAYGWCNGNAVRLAVASGKVVRNALGESLSEYYAWPIAINAAAAPSFKGFTTNKYLDWSFVGDAPATLPKVDRLLDAVGRPVSIVTPDGNTTQVNHEVVTEVSGGRTQTRFKTSVVDPRCTFTQYRRDARGLIVDVLEDQRNFFRDAAHPIDDVVAGGRTKAWCQTPHDADAAVVAAKPNEAAKPVTDLRLSQTAYVYDAMTQLTDVILSRRAGIETARIRIAYDNFGRRIRVADPDRGTENTQFDRMGNVRLRDYSPLQGSGSGQSKSILQEFDANRVVATRYPASPQLDVRYRYDSFVGFDFKDWQPVDAKAAKVLADQIGDSCDNCVGRVIATQDRAGLVAQDYDVFGQAHSQWKSFLVDRVEKGRFSIRKDYDRWGLLKSHQVQELEPQSGNTLCFATNPRRFVCDLNETVRYGYNRSGQVHRIDHESDTVARFAYDAFGALGAKWTSDGSTTRYTYSKVDRRLSTLTTRLFDGTAIQNVKYNYDPGGNILNHTNDAGVSGAKYQTQFAYNYDAANRIISFSGHIKDDASSFNQPVASEVYRYDTLHRMQSLKVGSIENQYQYVDDMDVSVPHPLHAPRLIEAGTGGSDSRSTFHYDDWGNLSKTNRIGGSGKLEEQRVLRWDAENRLSGLTVTREGTGGAARETIEADYTYDRTGKRAIKIAPRLGDATSVQQKEVNFNVSEILTRRWNENTAGLHFSATGKRIGSMRLAKTSQGTERFIYFYHSELPNGSVTGVTRPVGANAYEGEVIERLEYSPYGSVIERNRIIGPIASGAPAKSDKLSVIAGDPLVDRRLPFYSYSGKEFDLESGYQYFGSRYYDPKTATWLSADPALPDYLKGEAGGLVRRSNLSSYAFGLNSPISRVDETGRIIPALLLYWVGLAAVEFAVEISAGGAATYFLYQNVDVVTDPNSSGFQKTLAATGIVAGPLSTTLGMFAREAPVLKAIPEEEIPTFMVNAKKFPQAAENIFHAQQAGHPEILTYGGKGLNTINRALSLNGEYKFAKFLSLDEYPFAMSMEGGASAWIGHIPLDQNRAVGGLLGNFVLKHGLTEGSKFRVLLTE